MDQKRLILAIAISAFILLVYQVLMPHPPARQQHQQQHQAANEPVSSAAKLAPLEGAPGQGAPAPPQTEPPKSVPRLAISAPSVHGSISLVGARIDDLVLNDYRTSLDPNSPLVQLLAPRSEAKPYYVQYGWSAPSSISVKLPDNETLWKASASALTATQPVTLSWDNGEGLTFEIVLSIDEHYMFSVEQRVRNTGNAPVQLYPWSRIRRDYTPVVSGYYILFEGLLGVEEGRLEETTYANAKSAAEKNSGIAFEKSADGGWAGITDKYWLTALVPDQQVPSKVTFRYISENGDHYQVDYAAEQPQVIAPGAAASVASHMFAGAKVVDLLDRYEREYHIPSFDKAVDFGWFYFLTKPIFYALDWLNKLFGNFGIAILVFTVFVKALFFPLANYSYRSMSKMRLLGPKMQAMRERLKDDPARMQQEMMALYKAEGVNPASGCLPMLIQIPVFFSLYKVIFVTIEMRQAPFFGWIRDLSQPDPTNVFNLLGLLPFDPAHYLPLLHLGVWPLIMGITMFLQQKLNPPPPDPMQARMFQLMPVIFTFMLANMPAGLVIYWTWNNLLSIGQQWIIMRRTQLPKPNLAQT